MANPQAENGHIRIANELWNELLRRNFSKRQQNLILFIWRLSYGTGQKDCCIDKFNKLELAGMYKQDVKKELEFLRECNVLDWQEETMIFSINKNYKTWQITPNKNWDSQNFNELIHQNLARKKVSKIPTNGGGLNKEIVSKTLTFKSKRVSKTLTTKLVKYLPSYDSTSVIPTDTSSLKTVLYPLVIKDIKRKEEERADPVVDFLIKNKVIHPGGITQTLTDDLNDITTHFGFDEPNEMIKEATKDAVRGNGRTWKFIYNKLNLWRKQGIKNKNDLEFHQSKTIPFQPKKKGAVGSSYDPTKDRF